MGTDCGAAVTLRGGSAAKIYRRRFPGTVHDPLGAQAVVFAMLLDRDETVRRDQLAWLEQLCASGRGAADASRSWPEVMQVAPEARLPLIELAVPALRQMSPAQMREFLGGGEGAG